jgi:hypothetical protein
MATAVTVRADFSADELRRLAVASIMAVANALRSGAVNVRKLFHPAARPRVMARRLLPLTVLTGIFAALGTGFSSCSSAETPSLLS